MEYILDLRIPKVFKKDMSMLDTVGFCRRKFRWYKGSREGGLLAVF